MGQRPGYIPSIESRIKQGATKLGIPVDEYRQHVENGNRWCSLCKRWQPVGEFLRHGSRGGGVNTMCTASWRVYMREYMRAKRGYQGRQHALKGAP